MQQLQHLQNLQNALQTQNLNSTNPSLPAQMAETQNLLNLVQLQMQLNQIQQPHQGGQNVGQNNFGINQSTGNGNSDFEQEFASLFQRTPPRTRTITPPQSAQSMQLLPSQLLSSLSQQNSKKNSENSNLSAFPNLLQRTPPQTPTELPPQLVLPQGHVPQLKGPSFRPPPGKENVINSTALSDQDFLTTAADLINRGIDDGNGYYGNTFYNERENYLDTPNGRVDTKHLNPHYVQAILTFLQGKPHPFTNNRSDLSTFINAITPPRSKSTPSSGGKNINADSEETNSKRSRSSSSLDDASSNTNNSSKSGHSFSSHAQSSRSSEGNNNTNSKRRSASSEYEKNVQLGKNFGQQFLPNPLNPLAEHYYDLTGKAKPKTSTNTGSTANSNNPSLLEKLMRDSGSSFNASFSAMKKNNAAFEKTVLNHYSSLTEERLLEHQSQNNKLNRSKKNKERKKENREKHKFIDGDGKEYYYHKESGGENDVFHDLAGQAPVGSLFAPASFNGVRERINHAIHVKRSKSTTPRNRTPRLIASEEKNSNNSSEEPDHDVLICFRTLRRLGVMQIYRPGLAQDLTFKLTRFFYNPTRFFFIFFHFLVHFKVFFEFFCHFESD